VSRFVFTPHLITHSTGRAESILSIILFLAQLEAVCGAA
jgi:hypothetical protein